MAAIAYLPAPIKVEKNHRDTKPDYLLYLCCSVALGILSYYAPKIFLGVSGINFVYQVIVFNRFVQENNGNPQNIHRWTTTACLVTWSIGTVFVFKSFPFFWSAIKCTGLKEISRLHLIPTLTHFAKGFLRMTVAMGLAPFQRTAQNLASQRRWVALADYVANYPAEVKQTILSSYWKQIKFYISACVPQTELAAFMSSRDLCLNQFQPVESKTNILRKYFDSLTQEGTEKKMQDWTLAIHQLQQLPIENLKTFGKILKDLTQHLEGEYMPVPNDVEAAILNAILSDYKEVPHHDKWGNFSERFERLDRENQLLLGTELLRLAGAVKPLIPTFFSEPMRLAILIAEYKNGLPSDLALTQSLRENLGEGYKEELKQRTVNEQQKNSFTS
ncbi:MAG TPA: hypothetical protein VHK67_05535 [Rhabdochlamydiaceae bacterium]|jgi:hypothetical protein|nr:hypothetical protein [Rhabdochlamydiaceae bacterium]